MLASQTRRVRTVRLTAPREDLIQRGALLLEDALHTASLPEASAGRLLVVRSLHVGTIRTDQSAATLSLTIEQRLRELALLAVHASDLTAPGRVAVYFRDAVEPAVLLALRLARRQDTTAWFWRLAVPAWRSDMTTDEALRTIFFAVTQTPPGVIAAVRLAHELAEHGVLDALLTALRPADGSGLLHAFGWAQTAASAAVLPMAHVPGAIPAPWHAVVARWIPHWQADARAVWLAGVALVAANPLRLLHPEVTAHAARHIVSAVDSRAYGTVSLPGSAPRRAPTQEHAPLEVSTSDTPFQPRTTNNGTLPGQTPAAVPDAPDYGTPHASPHPVEPSDKMPATAPLPPPPTLPPSATPEFSRAREPWPETPPTAPYAGLFFLVPVLARLGIVDFLTPALIEAAFPWRLLRYIGQHFGMLPNDPLQTVFATDAADALPGHFVTPASWQHSITTPGKLLLRRGTPGTRVLCDASGRLPLAQWQQRMPESVRLWARQAGLRRHPTPLSDDVLLRAWLVATRRWLRRQARLGLAEVVRRPGCLTATRTHIDIFFALGQADIRIRRVGLDIDPGWVPWLGRVISFHYEEHRR